MSNSFTSANVLTLAGAKKAMAAAEAEAAKNNVNMSIAILDGGGNLLHLSRMDSIHIGTVEVAIAKARCAVLFKRPTKAFQDGYAGGMTALPALPGVLPFEGGVPIMIDGNCVGAVGASGSSPDMDGKIASAGVAAVQG